MDDDYRLRAACNADGPAVRGLVYAALCEHDFVPDPQDTDADLADLELSYTSRGGAFDVLVDTNDRVIGTVGLYPQSEGRCELRKMYLAPGYRGRGLGKRLLRHAMERARVLGFKRIELETASRLVVAQQMYEAFGFQRFVPTHMPGRCDRAYFLDLEQA